MASWKKLHQPIQEEIQMQERMKESIVVLLIFAAMASLIQAKIPRVQWAHRVNIRWTTGMYCFPQDLMPWTTWHLYKLQHLHFGKGGDGADNKVWLPKGRGSRWLIRAGFTSTYSFPPAAVKALHLFSKCASHSTLSCSLHQYQGIPGGILLSEELWFCCFSWTCVFVLAPWSNQMCPGLCEPRPEKFIGLVYWYNQWFFTMHCSSPVVGLLFHCTFGNICGSPHALWPG